MKTKSVDVLLLRTPITENYKTMRICQQLAISLCLILIIRCLAKTWVHQCGMFLANTWFKQNFHNIF